MRLPNNLSLISSIDPVDEVFVTCAFSASTFMEKAYGIKPDPWQKELLDTPPSNKLLLCSRQSGKSTVCAVMALHRVVYYPSSLVLIISKTLRQAKETFRKVKLGLEFIQKSYSVPRDTMTDLELKNGSRIVSLPGDSGSVRSFSSVSQIIIDEAAYVSDELYATVTPMIAVSKGKVIALSTSNGKSGWFYRAWSGTNDDWYRVMVTADDCPRITKEHIEEQIKIFGNRMVRQEYYCEFLDTDDQVFGYDEVHAAIDYNLKPITIN